MKAHRVVIGVEAAQDLDSLYAYITDRSGEAAARRFIAKLRGYCLWLATAPHRGTKRDDLLAGLRLLGFRRRATFGFVIDDDAVVILRILYRGRNVEAEFSRGVPEEPG